MRAQPMQADLFSVEDVARAYADVDQLDNQALYERMAQHAGVSASDMDARTPIGKTGQRHSTLKRQLRWYQQTLKHLGALERVDGARGQWRLTDKGRRQLTQAEPAKVLVALSTELGIALHAHWESVFPRLDEPLHLCLTSPPYALRKPRGYGNPDEQSYVDFLIRAMEPIVAHLVPGGSICLNVSNDLFEPGMPSRSMYLERLTLAMHDRLGLKLMDRLVWHNASKAPGPVQYASKTRQQLNVAYEFCLWFTNDPLRCFADNRRVLQPHSDRHRKLLARGGERRQAVYSDGAYRIREGSFGNQTEGKIPRNVLAFGHRCSDAIACNKFADANGLPRHGAPMPLALADFLVRFLSRPGDLVVDPFGGRLTTAKAAEVNDRRWITTEMMLEYLVAGRSRFAHAQ